MGNERLNTNGNSKIKRSAQMTYPTIKKVIYWWWKYWNFSGVKEEPIDTENKNIKVNKKYKEVYIDNRN